MTTQHLESPATKTPAPELAAPDTAPPSPPPSRGPSRQRASKCAALEDPFTDPPVSREGSGDPRQDSSSTENPFFSDDEDEPQQGKGKGKGKGKESEETRWRRCLRERNLTLTLENSGSVARDHLASERTFLAYVRTSLTMSSAGVGTSDTSPGAWQIEGLTGIIRRVDTVIFSLGLKYAPRRLATPRTTAGVRNGGDWAVHARDRGGEVFPRTRCACPGSISGCPCQYNGAVLLRACHRHRRVRRSPRQDLTWHKHGASAASPTLTFGVLIAATRSRSKLQSFGPCTTHFESSQTFLRCSIRLCYDIYGGSRTIFTTNLVIRHLINDVNLGYTGSTSGLTFN